MFVINIVVVISNLCVVKGKAVSTVTGLEWPRGFQELKVPRFHDNNLCVLTVNK
jgi:hypothetical protein